MSNMLKQAIEGLLKQGKKSEDEDGLCVYRAPDGSKCAVGMLIKDEYYRGTMEGETPHDPCVHEALTSSLGHDLTRLDVEYLNVLQRAHDRSDSSNFIVSFKNTIETLVANGELPQVTLEYLKENTNGKG